MTRSEGYLLLNFQNTSGGGSMGKMIYTMCLTIPTTITRYPSAYGHTCYDIVLSLSCRGGEITYKQIELVTGPWEKDNRHQRGLKEDSYIPVPHFIILSICRWCNAIVGGWIYSANWDNSRVRASYSDPKSRVFGKANYRQIKGRSSTGRCHWNQFNRSEVKSSRRMPDLQSPKKCQWHKR
jgi:hypothetical protein